jgi:hypothetical protein
VGSDFDAMFVEQSFCFLAFLGRHMATLMHFLGF